MRTDGISQVFQSIREFQTDLEFVKLPVEFDSAYRHARRDWSHCKILREIWWDEESDGDGSSLHDAAWDKLFVNQPSLGRLRGMEEVREK